MFNNKKLSLRNIVLAALLLVAACDGEGCNGCDGCSSSKADPAPDTPSTGCLVGYVRNASGSCVKQCPDHHTIDGASCKPDPIPSCPTGFEFNTTLWACVQNVPTPSNPSTGCPGNSFLSDGKCLCPVNTGWNGTACVAPSGGNPNPSCNNGYYWNGNTCVPNGGGNPSSGFPNGSVTNFDLSSNSGEQGDCFMATANRSAAVWGHVTLTPSDYGPNGNDGISIGCRSPGIQFESDGKGDLWQCGLNELGCGNNPAGSCIVSNFSPQKCLLRTEGENFGDPAYDPQNGQKWANYFIGLCGNNCN